jgi:hypothetical protein
LILVDPVIYKPYWDPPLSPEEGRTTVTMLGKNPMASGALSRRSAWKSRDEARKGFSSPFFKAWDPAVLEQYITNGLYDDRETGLVRLKMAPIHEALVFTDTFTGAEPAWFLVPTLDEKVEIRWVMPGEGKPG